MAQLVEHILGKDEVIGSIPISSSKSPTNLAGLLLFIELNIFEKTHTKWCAF